MAPTVRAGERHLDKLTKIPVIDPDTCVGTGECVRNCSRNALKLVGSRAVLTDAQLCRACKEMACEFSCPTGAITIKYQKL
jgi:NAD-dependent dihydropyrimidine dehydrogenase PreA subunit